MKIISWNVRGLGGREKRRVVKDFLSKEKPDLVTFQETKKEKIDRKLISSVWGSRFKEWAFLPSSGNSGGILLMWDSRVLRGKEVLLGNFSASVSLEPVGGGDGWWFSGIYGPCNTKNRDGFWEELAALYGLCGEKWCLGGDFNVTRYPSEKLNGASLTKSMRNFDQLIREMGLKDLPLKNSDFTWSNMRENLVCTRIDRFLFMDGWESLFEEIRQEALIRVISDHCPITLDTSKFKWGPTPFRFENMWLKHKSFKNKWQQWWNQSGKEGWAGYKFIGKLNLMKTHLRKWNKEEFGDVRLEKRAIMNRLNDIDKLENQQMIGEDDIVERRNLRRKLEKVIISEEISWNQKVRIKGVKEWDNNSKLFHRIASGRKINNIINKLENRCGVILHKEEEIEKEIIDFFEDLFRKDDDACFGIEGLDWVKIDDASRLMIEEPFKEEEVRRALFDCEGDKAPGRMGSLWQLYKKDGRSLKRM